MKRILALLCVLTITGCGLLDVEPVPPESPPKTHVTPAPKKVADKVETLHFYATWCGPCAAQKPVVEALKLEGYDITDDNVDKKDSRGDEFNIHSVPTYVVLVNGKEKYRTQSAMELGGWLRKHDGRKVQTSESGVSNVPQAGRKTAQAG